MFANGSPNANTFRSFHDLQIHNRIAATAVCSMDYRPFCTRCALSAPFKIPLLGTDFISILALLMALTMFIQQKQTVKDPRQAAMVYMMPAMFWIMFNSFPSGLNLYYFTFNLLSIIQQWYVNRNTGDFQLQKVPQKKGKGWMEKAMSSLDEKQRRRLEKAISLQVEAGCFTWNIRLFQLRKPEGATMKTSATILLKAKEERRIRGGHPWVFSNEIQNIEGQPSSGDVVAVLDSRRGIVGYGFSANIH